MYHNHLAVLRSYRTAGTLHPGLGRALDAAKPGWDTVVDQAQVRNERWAAAVALLRVFATREGHASPRQRHLEDGVDLGNWVLGVRDRYKRGKLTPARVADLEAIPGWFWSATDPRLDASLASLDQFVAREGHANVPQTHIEGANHRLGQFVYRTRINHARGALRPDIVQRLEQLPGWRW